MNPFEAYQKEKAFLVCVDSDGCAMDTMEVKHRKCFCPEMIREWSLESISGRVEEIWYEINLYSGTRGINRFKGLAMTLERLSGEGIDLPDFSALKDWAENADELSNPALQREAEKTGDESLKMALQWSQAVNKAIAGLPEDDKPFPNVETSLSWIVEMADIVVVSSANSQAIQAEWGRHRLDRYTRLLLGQEAGSKAACIGKLKTHYEDGHVLMVGDAPGDLKASEKNGVFFYPILVGKEAFSWKRLAGQGVIRMTEGKYAGAFQEGLIQEFRETLGLV